ncbi:transglycosylase domain-containing protein [Pragia fontium]|uniref:transglycosylase domain-containing protein n=1 Tax=Pragia fontium TaxID=82985 RepID=UPI0009421058
MAIAIYLGRTDDNHAIYGIENGAGSLFSTALSDLSCEQLAELIIIPQSPSYYKLGSERLSARTKRLLPVCAEYEQSK